MRIGRNTAARTACELEMKATSSWVKKTPSHSPTTPKMTSPSLTLAHPHFL